MLNFAYFNFTLQKSTYPRSFKVAHGKVVEKKTKLYTVFTKMSFIRENDPQTDYFNVFFNNIRANNFKEKRKNVSGA